MTKTVHPYAKIPTLDPCPKCGRAQSVKHPAWCAGKRETVVSISPQAGRILTTYCQVCHLTRMTASGLTCPYCQQQAERKAERFAAFIALQKEARLLL